MIKSKLPRAIAPALIFVVGGERYVSIQHEDIQLRITDTKPQDERSAADIIEEYIREYRHQLAPHLAEVARLSRLATEIRRSSTKPNLP